MSNDPLLSWEVVRDRNGLGIDPRPESLYPIRESISNILSELGIDVQNDANFQDTPRRVEAFLRGHFQSNEAVQSQLDQLGAAVFPSEYRGIIGQTGIRAHGMCPHHLVPVEYQIHIAYIPEQSVIGLSKLTRIACLIANLPILQEDVTVRIGTALQEVLKTGHIGVVVEGVHFCMVCRGVLQEHTVTTTSVLSGYFDRNDNGAKKEFFDLIQLQRR